MPKARPELFSLTQDKLSKCRTFRETTFFLMRTLNEPNLEYIPLDTGQKLNVGRLLNVSRTFNLFPVFRGIVASQK